MLPSSWAWNLYYGLEDVSRQPASVFASQHDGLSACLPVSLSVYQSVSLSIFQSVNFSVLID
jgi:hypothetical protein